MGRLKAGARLMTAEWKQKSYDRLLGRKYGKVYQKDRTDVPMGWCEFCRKFHELRPFGPKEEWICFECGMENMEAMNKALAKLNAGRLARRTGKIT